MIFSRRIKETDILMRLGLLFLITIFSLVVFMSGKSSVVIMLLYSLGIIAMSLVKFDLLHPYTWFIPFFLLYSTSSSILVINGYSDYLGEYKLLESLRLTWVAMVVFILVIGIQIVEIKSEKISYYNFDLVAKIVYYVSYILVIIMSLYVLISGAANKRDISQDDSILITLGMYGIHFFVLAFTIRIINKIKKNQYSSKYLISSAVILSLIVIFVVGERDFFLRILLIIIIIYEIFIKKIPVKILGIIGIVGIFFVSFLQNMKNIFISGVSNSLEKESVIEVVFGGEFVSAGRNLQILVQNNMSHQFFKGSTLLEDIKFAIGNLPLFHIETVTPTTWFNNTFYAEYAAKGGGKGFTLIGEGYIDRGFLGVIMIFILFGLIVKLFYKQSEKNSNWLLAYIILIPNTIYVLRADFGIYLSTILKYVVIPIVTIALVTNLISKSKIADKRKV